MSRISINDLCNKSSNEDLHSNVDENIPVLDEVYENEHFISRVSNFPIVNSALRAYESSKNSSSVVKYSAETVESGVRTICAPVISRFEPRLERLDDFACRQLDRIERTYSSYRDPTISQSTLRQRHPHLVQPENNIQAQPNTDFTQSRWKQVMVSAGAGVAFVSEESMKRLRYCLEWLHYASAHISRQINKINEYIMSFTGKGEIVVYQQHQPPPNMFINSVKKEIVETLRQVVEVIGRYAGSCLPNEARNRVRSFILGLPQRWATLNIPNLDNDTVSVTSCSSPVTTPINNNNSNNSVNQPSFSSSEAIQKLLMLANESSQLVQNVKSIFKETVDRADNWSETITGLKSFASNIGGLAPSNPPSNSNTNISLEMMSSQENVSENMETD